MFIDERDIQHELQQNKMIYGQGILDVSDKTIHADGRGRVVVLGNTTHG